MYMITDASKLVVDLPVHKSTDHHTYVMYTCMYKFMTIKICLGHY